MPIRKRGESWQVDIRTADGTRLRRSYSSQTEAMEAEALSQTKPSAASGDERTAAQIVGSLKVQGRIRAALVKHCSHLRPGEIGAGDVAAVCAELSRISTNANYRKTLYAELRGLLRAIGTGSASLVGIPTLRAGGPREVIVTELEFEQVYYVADGALQLAMLLARDAGLRHAAIWNITAANCNFEKRILSGKTKNTGMYLVPMTQRLYERLLFVCASTNDAQESLLATFNRRRKKPGYGSISNWLTEAKVKAGLPAKSWGFHDLRRTAARALYERTHDLRKVQRLLSHANMQQSCWYLGASGIDLAPADLEREVACPQQPKSKTA